ncbi:MAG: glycosyltransferase, partial [Blautia sp.]|nr:glycosyltransferase [Blautia sp.]
IGRLSEQKGFDIALKAAKNMKEKNFKFVWYIIGEGSDLNMLLEMRKEYNLIEEVVFLGAKKNPYYYIKNCDVFVQTSRFEGKSIVLDEAMILNKPIVVTNYTTVTSSITNGENGTIVEINPDDICEGIIKLYNNPELRKIYSKNLSITATGNEAEIAKYIDHLN